MKIVRRAGYLLLGIGIRTLGRLSQGIRIGLATGFDSGTIVDYVYRNAAHGTTPLGVWIDRAFLAHPVWQGVRDRRDLLTTALVRAREHYTAPVVFDVAAGPGSYLFALPVRGELYAGDISPREVAAGVARAAAEGRTDIHFSHADAFDSGTWPVAKPDVLVASGFFDILVDDDEVRRLLDAGTRAAADSARWVYTVMEQHTDTDLLRHSLVDLHGEPWKVRLRTAEQVAAMAPHGWRLEGVAREPRGFFAVATLVRGEAHG